jgi:hypothetical protein
MREENLTCKELKINDLTPGETGCRRGTGRQGWKTAVHSKSQRKGWAHEAEVWKLNETLIRVGKEVCGA